MTITITINKQTRAGKINTPYLTAHTVEQFVFAAAASPTEEIPDGTAVALLTPDRKTLAMSFVQSGCVTLNTNTQQAADYFIGCAVNEPKNAVLVVGDTDTVQTIIPVVVRANPLDDLAPPPPLAPKYPTSAQLDAILANMRDINTNVVTVQRDVHQIAGEVNQTVSEWNTKVAQDIGSLEDRTTELTQELSQHKDDALEEMDAVKEEVDTLADVVAGHEATALSAANRAETALNLVPEIAVDSEAVLTASRELVGTDPGDLASLSSEI